MAEIKSDREKTEIVNELPNGFVLGRIKFMENGKVVRRVVKKHTIYYKGSSHPTYHFKIREWRR